MNCTCTSGILAAFLTTFVPSSAQVAVTTAQFNNARTAANLSETTLNLSNVNVSSFGKQSTFTVTGQVFAQPLYAPGLTISGSPKDVLYVATMGNNIYAFDANNAAKGPFAQRTLSPLVPAGWAGTCPAAGYMGPQLGILSTPVADLTTSTLYVLAATPNGPGKFVHQLFALDMGTLLDKHAPVTIAASVPGNASDGQGGAVSLNQITQIQRTGLVLANGTVYVGFGGCGPDPQPYHGWLIGYNASTLAQNFVFNASPNGIENAIWQSGRAPVTDSAGSIYFFTGNGSDNGVTDFSESALKLSPSGSILDWFTPSNDLQLDSYDLDLSSSGPILMPDSNWLVGGGKEGTVYVLNPNNMGKNNRPMQSFQATPVCSPLTFSGCYQIHSVAFWNGSPPTLYVWGVNDTLRAYTESGGVFNTTPASQSAISADYPGGVLAVSSNGSQPGTGIVWATTAPGVLHAYDATNLANEVWNSNQNAGDSLGAFSKFGQPIIANGKVFVPTLSGAVVGYGLGCDSSYSGTFNGNLTFSTGRVCIANATITGNVVQSGGSLVIANASVHGDLQISGGTFSFGPGTVIGGNLQVQNIPVSQAQNQVCGATIGNDFQFHNNGVAIKIGSTSAPCPGNRIGGNLQIMNNTAPVQIFDNAVANQLHCQNNTASITGGANTARQKKAQCAAF